MSNKRVYLGRNESSRDVEIVDKHKSSTNTRQLVVKKLGNLETACSKSQADREELGKKMRTDKIFLVGLDRSQGFSVVAPPGEGAFRSPSQVTYDR